MVGRIWAAMTAIGCRLWPGRKREGLGLEARLAAVETRLDELEAAVEARRSGEAEDGSEASMGEAMREGAGETGGWPLREEWAGRPSAGSGPAGTPGAHDPCASRRDADTRDGTSLREEWAGEAGASPLRGEEMGEDGEMLEKARGSAGGASVAVEGGDGVGVEEQIDVRPGMPQGMPGQQARRKAARLWEGVL